ncbi:MAG: DUF503 domain-containing protein [Phycisphaeraceae bacterium]|nr:DUF503 domain-containing protein [Phycisphaeraceae bacterium]
MSQERSIGGSVMPRLFPAAHTMHIGILQFELHVSDSESLKDKRRVVRSVKDRLHREHQVSIAEVGLLDHRSVARLGLACVAGEVGRVIQVLDSVTRKLHDLGNARLGELSREVISDAGLILGEAADDGSPLWTSEEARDAGEKDA